MNDITDKPVKLTIKSQGMVDLLTSLLRAVSSSQLVSFNVDHETHFGILHKLEDSCSDGLPTLKVTRKK